MRTRLKVCCISSIDEARVAIAHGADALGLVATMPSGPGPIDDALVGAIARSVPPPVATFLLTCETSPDAVVDHVLRAGVNTVQLVDDDTDEDVWKALRSSAPAVRIVQVVHIRGASGGQSSRGIAARAAPHVDALLLDS